MLFVLTIVRKLARVHCCVAVIDVCALCCGPDGPLASATPAIRTSTHGAPAPEPGASKSGGRGSGAGWLSGSPLQGLGLWCFRMAAQPSFSRLCSKPPRLNRRASSRSSSPRAAVCTSLLSPPATPQCSAPRACCGCAKRREALHCRAGAALPPHAHAAAQARHRRHPISSAQREI